MSQEVTTKLSRAINDQNFTDVEQFFPEARVHRKPSNPDLLSPYECLYSCESAEILEFALKYVNPNDRIMDMDSQTLIYGHIRAIQEDTVEILVSNGADINIIDANGDTPLTFALKNESRMKMVPLLLKLGADPSFGRNIFTILEKDSEKQLLFHYFQEAFESMIADEDFKLVQKLIKRLRSMKNITSDFSKKLQIYDLLSMENKDNDYDDDDEGIMTHNEKDGINIIDESCKVKREKEIIPAEESHISNTSNESECWSLSVAKSGNGDAEGALDEESCQAKMPISITISEHATNDTAQSHHSHNKSHNSSEDSHDNEFPLENLRNKAEKQNHGYKQKVQLQRIDKKEKEKEKGKEEEEEEGKVC